MADAVRSSRRFATTLGMLLLGCTVPSPVDDLPASDPDDAPEQPAVAEAPPEKVERRECRELAVASPAKATWCHFKGDLFLIDIKLGERHIELERISPPIVDASGRYIWLVQGLGPGKTERMIVDVELGTTTRLRNDPAGRCSLHRGHWSGSRFIGWTWPEDINGPSRVNVCIVEPSGEIVHVLEQQRLCWGTAAAHYVLSVLELSGDALVAFHGGCSRTDNLGWMVHLGDESYRRIRKVHPALSSAEQADSLHGVVYGQDDVFTLEMSDSTFAQPHVIARGLGAEHELVFGPIEPAPRPEWPSDGLPMIR